MLKWKTPPNFMAMLIYFELVCVLHIYMGDLWKFAHVHLEHLIYFGY